jgi:uncharacterized protein YozE (UPF0346 family)
MKKKKIINQKKPLDIKDKELYEEAELLEASFNFWEAEVEKVEKEIEKVEREMEQNNPYETKLEKKLDELYEQYLALIAKGSVEDGTIASYQEKLNQHLVATKKDKKDDKTTFLDELGLLK